jgi:CDP-glucose 4,6-dehydratase
VETYYGYRETDALGGKDPYSASKGAAEIVIHSYVRSFFSSQNPVRIASTRAGNVVGGGDWAVGRLVPDIMRAWAARKALHIRQPEATRPWLHVLEPLSGYLLLGAELGSRPELHGESFNFGPRAEATHSVAEVTQSLKAHLPNLHVHLPTPGEAAKSFYEAGLLKLVSDKALHLLHWRPVLDFTETMNMTADWYGNYYGEGTAAIDSFSRGQLGEYVDVAVSRNLPWAGE